jgi:hypothetical protein
VPTAGDTSAVLIAATTIRISMAAITQ